MCQHVNLKPNLFCERKYKSTKHVQIITKVFCIFCNYTLPKGILGDRVTPQLFLSETCSLTKQDKSNCNVVALKY